MSTPRLVTMRSEEIPFELYNLNIDDYLQTADGEENFQPTMPCLTEQLSFMPFLLDSNSMSMFPETITITPLPIETSSPALSTCSSPPLPPTRSSTPPSPYTLSQPGSPDGKKLSSSPPTSGGGPIKPGKIPRHKRESHINAEHRRRHKIQETASRIRPPQCQPEKDLAYGTGLSDLQKYVPAIAESVASGVKDSKSSLLNKTSEYIRQLSAEDNNLQKEASRLRQELETLSADVNNTVQQLPSTGLEPPKPSDPNRLDDMFRDYTTARTFQNWKFFMFGLMAKPLFETFKQNVDTSSVPEFQKTALSWQEKQCSLTALRPVALKGLRELSKQTSIMTHPERLEQEALDLLVKDVAGDPNDSADLKEEAMS